MSDNLTILAGATAYRHIKENGLSPDDIDAMLGASGAAKWLCIYGLDSAIFSQWFSGRTRPLHLFGTSIGAWKFAAAAQTNCREAFERLKNAYIHQYYKDSVSAVQIYRETRRIMNEFLTNQAIDDILNHPWIRIGFSAARCKGIIGSKHSVVQAIGLGQAFTLNAISRKLQQFCFERVLFHHPQYDTRIFEKDHFPTTPTPLDRENVSKAILASGSIPMVMAGVTHIAGAPVGTYRDGGLLDYHPAFSLNPEQTGFILYPHFYTELTPGWFDKNFPKRRIKGRAVDRMILLAPSPGFVSTLPFGRIPDRRDFIRFMGRDNERIQAWNKAADMCRVLGDEFMDAAENGSIRDKVRKID
ncbi:patatin-like phospholipase family protein [uncultured Desulfobacter sp.]|uniref:patatin-like phospholipase family protein n=1 Tax=uncultured Desulfobacter sp. TaxID=240139 RepID=UPI0029C62428|nr:patatin-like phospholipase family protein [uncultured Desulfobacter sp.]